MKLIDGYVIIISMIVGHDENNRNIYKEKS